MSHLPYKHRPSNFNTDKYLNLSRSSSDTALLVNKNCRHHLTTDNSKQINFRDIKYLMYAYYIKNCY
jgi:hypothetical protein